VEVFITKYSRKLLSKHISTDHFEFITIAILLRLHCEVCGYVWIQRFY